MDSFVVSMRNSLYTHFEFVIVTLFDNLNETSDIRRNDESVTAHFLCM